MSDEGKEIKWYAVYTGPRAEKKVYESIIAQGILAYLPLQKKLQQWSDRKKIVFTPLIPSYVFVKITMKSYFEVLNTTHVVKFVKFSGKPAIIPEDQILAIKQLLSGEYEIEATTENFNQGDNVQIRVGPLKGLKGELIDYRNSKKVAIRVTEIGYSLLIDIPLNYLKKDK